MLLISAVTGEAAAPLAGLPSPKGTGLRPRWASGAQELQWLLSGEETLIKTMLTEAGALRLISFSEKRGDWEMPRKGFLGLCGLGFCSVWTH